MGLFRWTEMVYPGRNRRKTTHEALHQQLSVSLFLVCIEVRQKLTSHRYVENGSNVKIALFARVGNSLEVANQKFSKGRSAKLNFKPRSYLSLVSFSSSCKIMSFPPTDAELYVSLTQSRHSVEAEEKWILMTFHHNLKKKIGKIMFQIFLNFIFRVMVKIHRKLTILSTKMVISQKSENWFFICVNTFRIFHVYLSNFEEKKCYSKFIETWKILSTKTAISRKIWNLIFDSIQQCEKSK